MDGAFLPRVADDILKQYPDYRALSVLARNFHVTEGQAISNETPTPPPWMDAHVEAWRNAFRRFGANPKKTPSSLESLWKRLQTRGELPTINPVVDLYNALSIRFGAPFGGEDADRYAGIPQLGFAFGAETFDTARDGVSLVEHPEPGEVIWRDDDGVTCRRWNWRQCRRTGLSSASNTLWFVIDRLSPMPIDELRRAGETLVEDLRRMCPTIETSISLLEPEASYSVSNR